MKISVIIPVHNRRDVLTRALDSVYAQTQAPDEVIVVNDGSTDRTGAYLEKNYPDVVLLTQANKGVSAARNRGINHATADWVALLDSDDEWSPTKLESQVNAIGEEAGYLFCHTDEIWIRNGVRVNPMRKHQKHGGWIFQYCLPLCAISPSSVLMHKDVFHEVGLFDESLPVCEDYDLWLRICARMPVLFVDQPLTKKYGGHHDQLSRRYWGMDRFRVKAIEGILNENVLPPTDKLAAEQELEKKLRILLQGAEKHGNQPLIALCRSKLSHSPSTVVIS